MCFGEFHYAFLVNFHDMMTDLTEAAKERNRLKINLKLCEATRYHELAKR